MTRPPKYPPLTSSEERILRSTIDDTQIFEVPVRTVKKLLALLDLERAGRPQPTGDEPPQLKSARERKQAQDALHTETTRSRGNSPPPCLSRHPILWPRFLVFS